VIDATPALRVYARFRGRALSRQDAARTQERQLLRLVRRAARTTFGRAHGFASVRGVADFQNRVPLRCYEDFWRDFWEPAFPRLAGVSWPGRVPFLAVSSGTSSGTTKYIPVSPAMTRGNRRAALDVLVHHLAARPRSRVLDGAHFMLGGSTDLRAEAPGIRSGDLSGIAAAGVPFWARPWYFPPPELALVADWERKIDLLARASAGQRIRSISGTPSWLLLFFEKLASLRPEAPRLLAEHYPALELLVHGGVNFAPYRARFAAWLERGHAELREVYPASEGFIAIADRAPGEGMRMVVDHGIFYEFVPVSELGSPRPKRHWIATAEAGVDYALVLSTCAGLWSYVLGDVVRLVDRAPPRLLVTGRTSYFLSAYGEHLTGEEFERAVVEAAGAAGRDVAEFAVGPAPEAETHGQHVFVVEFAGAPPADLARFASTLDAVLSRMNDDYRAHREGGQMIPPRVVAVPQGCFTHWMRARGRLGGQNKVPRVITDPALLASLLDAAGPPPIFRTE
jgi:hypothetical protein